MATETADFTEVAILIGDGATPTEGFTEFCLVNLSKSFSKSANLTEDEVPDCQNPGNPMDIVRQVRSVDYSISGEGKLHVYDLATALAWCGGAAKNVRIEIGNASNGGMRIEGPFLLQTFETSAANKETASATVQFVPQNSGSVTEAALT